MRTKPVTVVLLAGMICLSAVSATAVIVLGLENRSLRTQLGETQRNWVQALSDNSDLRGRNAASVADLSVQQAKSASLSAELETLRQAKNTPAPPAVSVAPRSQRVRVFDATRFIGLGWLVPQPAASGADGSAGDLPPAVVLDQLVPVPAAAASDEPAAPTAPRAFSYSYSYQQPYYYWPTVWWGDGARTNVHRRAVQLPAQPSPRPAPAPTLLPSTSGSAPRSPNVNLRTPVQRIPQSGQPRSFPSGPVAY